MALLVKTASVVPDRFEVAVDSIILLSSRRVLHDRQRIN